jgi:FkbH-like protein
VCSKNDEANALRPFDERPEMILRRSDIACFVADWDDKAANLKRIAERLNIGLNTLVFVDDNPVERNLVRRELPMVAVPELPENPADYVACLAAAGYFESLSITEEDRERSREYRANIARDELRSQTTDMAGFLSTLQTKLLWSHFELKDIKRVVQLINKTNQFNLTTRRYTEPEVRSLVQREDMLTLQIRILDVYGNSGIIAILIGQRTSDDVLFLDSWLMSCRVLGRNVERATLTVLTQEARALGCTQIIGVYKPSARNQLVQAHYEKLGFTLYASEADGTTQWAYPLDQSCPPVEAIEIFKEEDYGATRNLLATH